jgi:AcrR family transcriptional regulator
VPRQGLDRERVVAAGAAIADAEGLEALTLARVAADLGVRPPSLYVHVEGLGALRRGIALLGVRELAAAMREAAVGRAREDALAAVARAYRAYALAHPGRYAATVRAPDPSDTELSAAAGEAVEVLAAVLRGWGLRGADGIHAVRGIRAALHGFAEVERAGGFGLATSVDESFERLVATLAAGLDQSPSA